MWFPRHYENLSHSECFAWTCRGSLSDQIGTLSWAVYSIADYWQFKAGLKLSNDRYEKTLASSRYCLNLHCFECQGFSKGPYYWTRFRSCFNLPLHLSLLDSWSWQNLNQQLMKAHCKHPYYFLAVKTTLNLLLSLVGLFSRILGPKKKWLHHLTGYLASFTATIVSSVMNPIQWSAAG